jgi:hypothetical protein
MPALPVEVNLMVDDDDDGDTHNHGQARTSAQ